MNGIKFLLDTNVVIGLLKESEAAIALAEQTGLELAKAAVSQITRMELLGYPKLPDAIVAATAITHTLQLLTLDKGMIQGLQRLGYEC